jgi:hypothetical protein
MFVALAKFRIFELTVDLRCVADAGPSRRVSA